MFRSLGFRIWRGWDSTLVYAYAAQCRQCFPLAVCAYYVIVVVCITWGYNVHISDSNDDDVNTGHGSLGAARPRKKKTLLQSGCRTIATPTSEALSVPVIGFSNPWPLDTTSVPASTYPNWRGCSLSRFSPLPCRGWCLQDLGWCSRRYRGWCPRHRGTNAWLGISLLAPTDSLESKSFFAYKVEFIFFGINSLLYMKNNQTKKIIT
jgi:hypothetical protein